VSEYAKGGDAQPVAQRAFGCGIIEECLHDIDAEVVNLERVCERMRKTSAAASEVNDRHPVRQAPAPCSRLRVEEKPTGRLTIRTKACSRCGPTSGACH
jgi:hypothetical protein